MTNFKEHIRNNEFVHDDMHYFFKWLILASIAGITGGLIGGEFAKLVVFAVHTRLTHRYLLFLMPLAGCLTVYLYLLNDEYVNAGTNMVILAIRANEPIKKRHGMLIFVSTLLSHFTGASVGKEGAALQIGGAIGTWYSELFKLDESDKRLMIMCGMSSLFGAVFGTPLGAAIFPIEVISIGVMYYAALFPCILASVWGCFFAKLIGAPADIFKISGIVKDIQPRVVIAAAIIGLLCALLSIFFTYAIHTSEKIYAKYFKNPYKRILVGSLLFIIVVLIFGDDYTGTGSRLIEASLFEEVPSYAFLLKILFTIIVLGAGFKGGEIVPTLAIGCCFGNFIGVLFGLDPHFSASLGMLGMFAGMTNCPIASGFMAIEMFGGEGTEYYGLVIALSYALSGYMGLYRAQKFMYSKTQDKYINADPKTI